MEGAAGGVVKRITDNKWGKSADGKTLTGPGGFTIDLSKCQAGWSDTEGLTDTIIKLGSTNALSGAAADYGNFTLAEKALFDYYSEQGAFKDSTGQDAQDQLHLQGRRLRPGPDHSAGRRAHRLRQGVRRCGPTARRPG